jgi:hypothetical protein
MRSASIRLARLARCDVVHVDELEASPSSESPQILDCRANNPRARTNHVLGRCSLTASGALTSSSGHSSITVTVDIYSHMLKTLTAMPSIVSRPHLVAKR